ncbi:MAG: sensor domain-containing diguanylate cyclase, partial [Sulfurimonas sp.]|nr:sensor domain-containing diguanylate cyclase [Sulfurimonas sp.]
YGVLFSLEEYFKNGENIKLGLKIKEQYIENITKNNLEFAYTLGLIIIIISIPIGILISIPTSKLYIDFNKLYKDNLRYMDTIDKYVITMSVDLDKKITYVSSALCEKSGYLKEELIGKSPSIFKSGKMKSKLYKDLWNKISSGLVWKGELQNRKKDGAYYWIDAIILPNYNKDNQIESYTSISKDITDKKIIEKISETDKLTQIFNRIKLDDTLENEFNRFLRHKHIFSLIIMDIDHFKSVNDSYGHQIGDSVLIEFANILKEHCRKTDIVGRWGGEEFMIICIDTDINGATNLAENLRLNVEKFEFDIVKHKTVSIGVSQVKDSDNIETIIKRVDDYLYKAKESGRNKVISDIALRVEN